MIINLHVQHQDFNLSERSTPSKYKSLTGLFTARNFSCMMDSDDDGTMLKRDPYKISRGHKSSVFIIEYFISRKYP